MNNSNDDDNDNDNNTNNESHIPGILLVTLPTRASAGIFPVALATSFVVVRGEKASGASTRERARAHACAGRGAPGRAPV